MKMLTVIFAASAFLTPCAALAQDCGGGRTPVGGTLTSPKPCKPGGDARQPSEPLRKRDTERGISPNDRSGVYIGVGGSITSDTRFRVR